MRGGHREDQSIMEWRDQLILVEKTLPSHPFFPCFPLLTPRAGCCLKYFDTSADLTPKFQCGYQKDFSWDLANFLSQELCLNRIIFRILIQIHLKIWNKITNLTKHLMSAFCTWEFCAPGATETFHPIWVSIPSPTYLTTPWPHYPYICLLPNSSQSAVLQILHLFLQTAFLPLPLPFPNQLCHSVTSSSCFMAALRSPQSNIFPLLPFFLPNPPCC